jgi:hypothetical protein
MYLSLNGESINLGGFKRMIFITLPPGHAKKEQEVTASCSWLVI